MASNKTLLISSANAHGMPDAPWKLTSHSNQEKSFSYCLYFQEQAADVGTAHSILGGGASLVAYPLSDGIS